MRFDVYYKCFFGTGDTRNEYLYAGEQYNAETGLYYNRARYMDPTTGTFISMDSYSGSIYDPVSLHKYLYANANPVTYTDPTGYFSFSELMVVQKIQGIINTVQMSSGLFKVLRWVNAITTVYDTFQQIKGLLNGEVTIGEVVYMIMSDMSIDAMLSWLCNTKLKYVLKPIMAIMAGDAAFKQMKDAWENGSTLDKVMYTAKFVAYCFGLVKQCFTGDTLVWTANGTVPIADIKVGDEVYAYDAETGEAIPAKVTDISVSETDELVHLTINGELIRTTASHPFYTASGEWKAAGDLMVGDRVVTMTGEATVEAVAVEKLSEAVTVYNLTVEGEHNYYVAENGVLVHNECDVSKPANDGGSSSGYGVSDSRRNHILEGEGPTDPGHGPNRGFSEGAFPDTWTDDQVISAIEDVANNPKSTWKQSTGSGASNAPITVGAPDVNAPSMTNKGTPVRFIVKGRNHGLNITVIVEPHGEGIITGYNSGR